MGSLTECFVARDGTRWQAGHWDNMPDGDSLDLLELCECKCPGLCSCIRSWVGDCCDDPVQPTYPRGRCWWHDEDTRVAPSP